MPTLQQDHGTGREGHYVWKPFYKRSTGGQGEVFSAFSESHTAHGQPAPAWDPASQGWHATALAGFWVGESP